MKDKVVLITGPARGIGAGLARALAPRGARLSLVGMEPALLASLAAELGERHIWFECDVTDQAALERAVAGTVSAFGGIDIVVANAGIASNGTVAVTPADALARVIEVNLIGSVRTIRAALSHVVARKGYVLFISSAASLALAPGLAAYAASKSGVEQFANALRVEVAHKGVKVGSAHPCWIDTDLVRDAQGDLESFNEMLRSLPGPFGKVTSLGECVAALVDGIERRKRKIFIPKSLAFFSAFRQFFMSSFAELPARRNAARILPKHEAEVGEIGRVFGEHSVEVTSRRS